MLVRMLKGFRGHPSHPPLTDVTIGAFTVGTISAVLAWLEVAPDVTAGAAFVAVVAGLVFAVPTAITGFIDYLDLPARSTARTTATIHLTTMLVTAGVYLAAAILLAPHARTGEIAGGEVVVSAVGLLLLIIGGWIGGSLAYVHGVRVVGEPEASPTEALKPKLPPPRPSDGEVEMAEGRSERRT